MLPTERAFSLPELLVGLSLSLLATILASQLLNLFWQVGGDIATKSQLQQMASVAMERVATDVLPSATPGVTTGDGFLALIRLADLNPDGQQRWEQTVILYRQRGPALLRQQVLEQSLSPHFPTCLSADMVKDLLQRKGGSRLSDCLDSFRANLTGAEGSSQTLQVTFRLSQPLRSGRRFQLELSREFYLRNAP